MTPHRVPLGLRVAAWRARPVAAVAAVVAACALAARLAAPPPGPTEGVVVARADLAPGAVLTADDLRTVRLPTALVPDTAVHDRTALLGAEVAVPVPRGLPVVAGHLTRSRFVREAPPGTVAVPVHLSDAAVAALLEPGDRVDLVVGTLDGWGGEEMPRVLARAALVLEVRPAEDAGAGLGLLPAGPGGAPLVVVAVPPEEGHLVAASGGGTLGAVLVQGS